RLPAPATVPPMTTPGPVAPATTPWEFPRATVPLTLVPMKLPSTTLWVTNMLTPTPLPEMRLQAAGVVPPTVLLRPLTITPVMALPSRIEPVTSVPMKLPSTRLPLPTSRIPWLLPEITLRSAASVPPITALAADPETVTPTLLATLVVPVASLPIQFPATVWPPVPSSTMPALVQALITNPRTVLLPPVRSRPMAFGPAVAPLSTTNGLPANPGCVVASIVTGVVIGG